MSRNATRLDASRAMYDNPAMPTLSDLIARLDAIEAAVTVHLTGLQQALTAAAQVAAELRRLAEGGQ